MAGSGCEVIGVTAHSSGSLWLACVGVLEHGLHLLIRARTREGRARAKARGQSLGRPFKLTPHQRKEPQARVDRGEPVREVARC